MPVFVPIVAGATLFTAPALYGKLKEVSDDIRESRNNTGSATVDNSNNEDVTETNDTRNNSLSTQELIDRENARYGNTFPQGSIGISEKGKKQATKQKEENKFSIKKDTFGKYSTRRRGGVLRLSLIHI